MKILFYDAKQYDEDSFTKYNGKNGKKHEFVFEQENISKDNLEKAKGFEGICLFVNSIVDEEMLKELAGYGVKHIFLRSMGYNNVKLEAAKDLGISVYRVPAYSAESVAEHAVGLMMVINRKLRPARDRVSKYNFNIDGLVGKAIVKSTVGVFGIGKIGSCFVKIMNGFGAKVLVSDDYAQENFPQVKDNLDFEWATKDEILEQSDFISLHAPLMPSTHHLINEDAIKKMKDGVGIINVSRGGLIDTSALLKYIKNGKIGGAGLDVLEGEGDYFFRDKSTEAKEIEAAKPEWKELVNNENVLLTSHQAFFTDEALKNIATITLDNVDLAEKGEEGNSQLLLQDDGRVKNG